MALPDWTIAWVALRSLRRVGRLAILLRSIRASPFLLFELNGSFHATQADTPVATIGTLPRSNVRDWLILGVGYLGRLDLERTLSFRF